MCAAKTEEGRLNLEGNAVLELLLFPFVPVLDGAVIAHNPTVDLARGSFDAGELFFNIFDF